MLLVSRTAADHRIRFRFERDRFVHRIERFDGGDWIGLWESVEGDDTQSWPASPTLQEVTEHEAATGRVLLGIGRAGRNHWSIVVESPLEDSTAAEGAAAFRFDVACRVGVEIGPLGSTYRPLHAAAHRSQWHLESSEIAPSKELAGEFEATEAWRCDASAGVMPRATRRWIYRWTP